MRIYSYVKNNLNITKSEVMILYKEGRILVNGKQENLSRNLRENEVVTVDGKELKNTDFVYYLYNKPKGVICTNNKNINGNIASILNLDKRIYAVGRLDKDTRGLIILTNDNKFTHYVLESSNIEKEYLVEIKEEVNSDILEKLKEPIIIQGKLTNGAKVKKISNHLISIILSDGRYHEVRKLVINAKCHLVDLMRIRIGNINLDSAVLKEGDYLEVKNLKELL